MARLRKIAARIRAEHPEVREVRLFGSLARGDYTGTSDVDILIVLEQTTESDIHRRILTFLPYFDLDRGVDVLVYTRAELERNVTPNPFLRRAVSESMVL